MRRRNLLPDKMKWICREVSFVVGFMATFFAILALVVLLAALAPFVNSYSITASDPSLIIILLPFFHCFAPLMFLVYICTSPHRPRRPQLEAISLPTDTAAHAPNFLSPSTASPTDMPQAIYIAREFCKYVVLLVTVFHLLCTLLLLLL